MGSSFNLNHYRNELYNLIHPTWFDRLASLLCWNLLEHKKVLRRELGEFIARELHIVDSMSAEERCDPARIDENARQRIAAGAGVTPQEVRQLIRSFEHMKLIKEGGWPPSDSN